MRNLRPSNPNLCLIHPYFCLLQIIRVLCSEQQCGLQPALEGGAAAFVIDGEDAPLGSAPWQAQVTIKRSFTDN